MKMKRSQKLRVKRESGKRPRDREQALPSGDSGASTTAPAAPGKRSEARDLPPNEKLRKFADEIYGDTEIPNRSHG